MGTVVARQRGVAGSVLIRGTWTWEVLAGSAGPVPLQSWATTW